MDRGSREIGGAGWRREYRLAPEYRRSSIIVVVGIFVTVATSVWVARLVGPPSHNPSDPTPLIVICLGTVLFAWFVHRWRLRVDEYGITVVFLRRHFWPWEVFEAGRVERKRGYHHVRPDLPWHRRCLHIQYMADRDMAELIEIIDQFWTPPPPPAPIDHFEFREFRARITEEGVRLKRRGVWHEFRWPEVQKVQMVLWDRECNDFDRIRIITPQGEYETRNLPEGRTWSGSPPEVVRASIEACVDPARLETIVLDGPVLSEADRELRISERQRRIDENLREVRRMYWYIGLMFGGICIWIIAMRDWVMLVFLIIQSCVMIGILIAMVNTTLAVLRAHLAAARTAPLRLPTPDSPSPPQTKTSHPSGREAFFRDRPGRFSRQWR